MQGHTSVLGDVESEEVVVSVNVLRSEQLVGVAVEAVSNQQIDRNQQDFEKASHASQDF